MKKVMLAAAASGSGKTTVTLGLLQLLQNRGLTVQPYKVGPDYVDTEYHTRITGRASRNLDMFLVREPKRLQQLFAKEAQVDVCVIEGVMGLFDGLGVDKDYCSSAGVAKQLDCPVVLVVDGQSASTSVAAVVKGFADFDPELQLCGVIINKVASQQHYSLIKKAVETYTELPVLGYLQRDQGIQLPSRQLGLVPDREIQGILEVVNEVAAAMEQTVAVDQLLCLLKEEIPVYQAPVYPQYPELTVAYALDDAFHFYYPDNLELLQAHGVTLKQFSPLHDQQLPEADLYYFGGGYPEEFAPQLAANQRLRQAIYQKYQEQKCMLAECGGLMYLGTTLHSQEQDWPMVGIFQGTSYMTKGLKRFGYCYGEPQRTSLLGGVGTRIYGHEFHHSLFETSEPPILAMTKERDQEIVSRWQGGCQKGNVFASYLHLHFYQQPDFLAKLLERVKESGGRGD